MILTNSFVLRDCRKKVLIGVAAVMLVLVFLGFGEHELLLPSPQLKDKKMDLYLICLEWQHCLLSSTLRFLQNFSHQFVAVFSLTGFKSLVYT